MKQVKILINTNIIEKSNRENFEEEINAYLNSGWSISNIHSNFDNNGKVIHLIVCVQK